MRVGGVEKKPLHLVVLRAKWPRASGGGDGFAARALRSTNPARAPGTAGNAAYDDTCGSINAIAGQVAEKNIDRRCTGNILTRRNTSDTRCFKCAAEKSAGDAAQGAIVDAA